MSSSMEFWGIEVKPGEQAKVKPEFQSMMIYLSQAALGESKKGKESATLFVKFGEKKLVLGTLSPEKIPQLTFDLAFQKEFELSHNWKHGSVYFCGYQATMPEEFDDFPDYSGSEDEEDLPLENTENAKPVAIKANEAKARKPKATLMESKKENESDDDDESDEDDESEEDDESDQVMSVDEDSDEEDDESDSEDEETPKKVETSKKRPNEYATKTPVTSKKAKVATPEKADGKKAGQVTPHPAKNAGKAAANGNNSKTPKSGGQFSCKSCDRSFGSDAALKSHSQAKHRAK